MATTGDPLGLGRLEVVFAEDLKKQKLTQNIESLFQDKQANFASAMAVVDWLRNLRQ
jgi:hypothetical protein